MYSRQTCVPADEQSSEHEADNAADNLQNKHPLRPAKKRLPTTPCAKSDVYRHNAPKRRDWCPVAEAYSSVNGPHKPPALRISKRRHPSENKQGACGHMRRNCKLRADGNGGGSGGERLGCSHNTCLGNCLCFEYCRARQLDRHNAAEALATATRFTCRGWHPLPSKH